MDLKNGGQTRDLQRQAAMALARRKVLAAYVNMAKKSADDNSRLKDEQVNPKVNAESWKKYHSAWQDYYQKYYSEYYSSAAINYVEKERLRDAREQEMEREILRSTSIKGYLGTQSNSEKIETDLRTKIRKKATASAKATRRHRHLIPITAGVFTVLMILFFQYNRLVFAPLIAYVSPGNAPATTIEAIDPTVTQTVSPDPRLIIPKLNVDVPVRFGVALADVMQSMNNGVTHYRIAGADALPGQIGNFIVTGHSAGDIYSRNPYKYIFSGLERLENGDLIYMNYNSTRYTYRVVKKEVIEPTMVSALVVNTDKPIITLVTCTPLGTSKNRLLVTGEQIAPHYNTNEIAKPETKPETEEPTVLPANEPSLFERIWDWLTGK